MTETYSNRASSTLTSALTAIATVIPVVSTTTFPTTGTFRVIIDSELLIVSTTDATTLTASERGAESTTAVVHASGAPATHVLTKGALDALIAQISGVASVSGTAPIVSTGGTAPAISISAASGAAAGSMSAADKTKLDTVPTFGANVATFLGTPTSTNFAAAVTDETGTGALMFGTSPTVKTALHLRNPGDTFSTTIVPAAVAANRDAYMPLQTGGDTIVMEAHAATLENKTLASPTVTGTVTYQGTKLRILSIPGEVQTTTATTAVIATFTLNDETSVKLDFTAAMKAVGAVAKAGGWTGSATYYRTGGGAPTLAGAAAYGTAEETTAGDGVTFDVSGNAVRVLATAADVDDRNWTCEFRVQETLATA